MRKLRISLVVVFLCFTVACSPRDFLTRRLATTLIAGSDTFKTTQPFWLRTGVISNKDYSSPEYLVLQRRGWITGANVPCATDAAAKPLTGALRAPGSPSVGCWDVALTPLGIETFRDLIPNNAAPSRYFSVPAARRELIAITGVSKDGNFADVDFSWKWVPSNEVGAALYAGGVQYNSTVGFRHYDDGWRVVEASPAKGSQDLEEALKNAVPAQ
jgi:hypothetical protein